MPLFLFTGEEDILLQQELTKRKTSFVEKYGSYGLFDFASDALDPEQLQNALMSGGMFATKKLVIIRGVPLDTTAHNKAKTADTERTQSLIEQWLGSNDPETIVVCISYKPDKRTKPYKRFASNAQLKEFPILDDKQKEAFVKEKLGSLVTPMQATHLVLHTGSLGHLHNELTKLSTYAQVHTLSRLSDQDIESVIWSSTTSNNFALLDHLYTNKQKALELITLAQQSGEDTFQFLGMLYWSIKMSIQILNLHEHGISDSKTVASTLKAHPFVVSKQVKLLPVLQEKKDHIYRFYNDIIDLDEHIKTGLLPAEGFWLALKQAIQIL